jgi:hypothetical protein
MTRWIALLALAASTTPAAAQSTASLRTTIDREVRPTLDTLINRLVRDGRGLTIDGTPAFNGGDKFLPGKIAIAVSHLIVGAPAGSAERARRVRDFRTLADLTVADANETWGTYYYLSALVRLQRAGVLNEAVAPATLTKLRTQLDWRPFVRVPGFTLVNLPTNYYGVAFSVARLRFLLGWEDASASDSLLARTVAHYQQYSGAYGFSDETDGEGRFDRYSILLIGEICQRFIETGLEVPPQLRQWLRGSVDVLLARLTPTGEGIDYGRSIGPYGETAIVEVLSAAATLGILTPTERDMAYTFSVRVAERYARFWIDRGMQSVNLWEHGRGTDGYRGKHRILGENLSLVHQLLYTTAEWDALGYRTTPPRRDFATWLAARPAVTLTWFARGDYDRALLTVRDGLRVFSLPVINGGTGQHANAPYYPVPFSPGLVVGVAETTWPLLTPSLRIRGGAGDSVRTVMPLAYATDLTMVHTNTATTLSWRQDALDWIGARGPRPDSSVSATVRYRFTPGAIAREDVYQRRPGVAVESLVLEYAVPATATVAEQMEEGTVIRFATGAAASLLVQGAGECRVLPAGEAPALASNVGPLATRVRCERSRLGDGPIRVQWQLVYRRK